MFSKDYTNVGSSSKKGFDQGQRDYMLRIYNLMAIALVVTGAAAFMAVNFEPLANLLFNFGPNGEFMGQTGFGFFMSFAPLILAFYLFSTVQTLSVERSRMLLWAYSALMGVSLAFWAFIYTGESIARTFFITSSVFAAMSIYGYTTKRDLTEFGSFLVMGLIGIIIASLVNIFLASPAVYFAISFMGVGIFIGLTAYDTQKLKHMYYAVGGGEMGQRYAVVGALTLYLDFINLFLHLLRFFGDRRN